MKTDLVLINPPLTLQQRYGNFAKMGSEAPPVGIGILAACARKEGYNVKILDAPAEGMGIDETVREVKRINPRIAGISSTTIAICNTFSLAQGIKKAGLGIKVIVGGCHVTCLPEETLQECEAIDMGVIGEGELTLPEILSFERDKQGDLGSIEGIVYRDSGGNILKTPPRKYIMDLDSIPFPAWDMLPDLPTRYKPSPHSYLQLPSSSLVTTRGCNGKCIYCVRFLSEQGYRRHSAEYTLGMVEYLIKHYGVRDILFYDDNFLLDKKRTREICEKMIQRNYRITWSCLARPEVVPLDLLNLMKEAGCWQIAFGLESGDQRILDILKKGVKVEKVEKVLEETVNAGIRTRGYFMLGCPGETEESIENTIAFVKRAHIKDFHSTF